MSTTTVVVTLTNRTCPDCGGVYAISQEYLNDAYDKGGFKQCWTCPYCKSERGYGDGKLQKLERELERTKQVNSTLRTDLVNTRSERDHHWTERKKLRTRHHNMRKRTQCGVCPCCKRTFENLGRHMKSKHPLFNYEPEPLK